MKLSKFIATVSSLVILSTSVHAAGYGGAVIDTTYRELLYLECTAEDLGSEEACTEFQIVTSNEDGSNKQRADKFSLKSHTVEDIGHYIERNFKDSINDDTDDSWFNSTGIMFDGIGVVGEAAADVAPITTFTIAVILAIPVVLAVPVIGLTADLFKSPVVAIKDAVLKSGAEKKAYDMIMHLLNRNTTEVIEISRDFRFDIINVFRYDLD